MNKQEAALVDAAQLPGVVVMNGKAYGKMCGKWAPVVGALRVGSSYIPVLDIPQLDGQSSRKAAEA